MTTCIKELPSNLSWTYEAEISPLSLEAARQTYLAIDSSRGDMNSDSLKTLDELLKELDYVPLAIRLLVTVGRGLSPPYLLGQWREERTELLELRKDRQSSIAVSISASLSQLKIANNPETLHLLSILSFQMDCRVGRIAYRKLVLNPPESTTWLAYSCRHCYVFYREEHWRFYLQFGIIFFYIIPLQLVMLMIWNITTGVSYMLTQRPNLDQDFQKPGRF